MEFREQLLNYQQLVNDELKKYLRHGDCYEKRWNEAMISLGENPSDAPHAENLRSWSE